MFLDERDLRILPCFLILRQPQHPSAKVAIVAHVATTDSPTERGPWVSTKLLWRTPQSTQYSVTLRDMMRLAGGGTVIKVAQRDLWIYSAIFVDILSIFTHISLKNPRYLEKSCTKKED